MRTDPQRLAALRHTLLLDSGPERAFDDLTRLLASNLGVPIVMVNLLDAERDWFKSCIGLPLTESPAATSFCDSFFHEDSALILVEDTTQDPRFADHPLVVGAPNIRFYAAARLQLHGHTLGTLCAYDLQPRQLEPSQVQDLRTMAGAVMQLIQQR